MCEIPTLTPAKAQQVRTLDKGRLGLYPTGKALGDLMVKIDVALRLRLAL